GRLEAYTSRPWFYAGVFVGSFSRFFFAVCSCFFIFCFRALSLSFLPLSPIAYLLFPLFRPLVHDHNPQRADGSSRLCLRLGVSGHPCSIELSLTSDLKRKLGVSIGNHAVGSLPSPGTIAELCFSLGTPFNANLAHAGLSPRICDKSSSPSIVS